MRIQLKKTILGILKEPLQEQGFVLDLTKNDLWTFSRTINSIRQRILIDKSNHVEKALRLEFDASYENGRVLFGQFDVRRLLSSEEKSRLHMTWWLYQTQEELEGVLHRFLEIIFHKGGMQWFEYASQPIPSIPVDVAKRLMEQSIHSHPEGSTLEQIEQSIYESRQVHPEPDWDLFVEMAARFGAFTKANLGGEWQWNDCEQMQQPMLTRINGKDSPGCTLHPLSSVVLYWSNPFYTLRDRYEQVLRFAHR